MISTPEWNQDLQTLPKATLVFLTKGTPIEQVLMGYKKWGFGQGKYTGFGGKVEPGETILDAAIREMEEESGVVVSAAQMQPAGELTFHFPHLPAWSQQVHVFLTSIWRGIPTEHIEMIPVWFPIGEIPYEQMWDDGIFWLLPILRGKRIRASFLFSKDSRHIQEAYIQQVNFLSR